ncbi:hypothetical protein HDU89_002947 [Geranomyces variabilis]|nr:hypothetical protein HDU89_002947 [Geranomyces variabilis]
MSTHASKNAKGKEPARDPASQASRSIRASSTTTAMAETKAVLSKNQILKEYTRKKDNTGQPQQETLPLGELELDQQELTL